MTLHGTTRTMCADYCLKGTKLKNAVEI